MNPYNAPYDHHGWIVTSHDGDVLFLHLPNGEADTPMLQFLRAVFIRADEDLGWWEKQVLWLEERDAERPSNVRSFDARKRQKPANNGQPPKPAA